MQSGIEVLNRSQCVDGLVAQGMCFKYETQDVPYSKPCKGANSCSSFNRVCVRGYCHEKCAKGQDCITVDNVSIVRKNDCEPTTSFSCAIHGDNSFCRFSVCKDRLPGGRCDNTGSLDECAGDRVQGCFNAQCTPTCFSDGDCESGQMCSFYFGKHGVCITESKSSSFPDWAVAVIVLGVVSLIIAVMVVIIVRRRKKRKQKQAVTASKPEIRPEQSFAPYAPMASSSSGVNTSWQSNSLQFFGQQTFAPSQQQPHTQSFVPYSPAQSQAQSQAHTQPFVPYSPAQSQSQSQQPFVPYNPSQSQQPFVPYSPSQPQPQPQAFVPYSPPKAQNQNSANTFASNSAKTNQGDSHDLPNYSDYSPSEKPDKRN